MAKLRLVMVFLILGLLFNLTMSPNRTFGTPGQVRWAPVNLPTEGAGGGWVLASGSNIENLVMATDGTLYASASPDGTGYRLCKSVNQGASWSFTGGLTDSTVDIAPTPDNASVIYCATASRIYRSNDGAASFTEIVPYPGGAGSDNIEITSIAVARLGDSHIVVAATRDNDSGQYGGVYTLKEDEPLQWLDTQLENYDVCAVAASPGFGSDRQLVAVINDEEATYVTWKTSDGEWGDEITSAYLNQDNSPVPTPISSKKATIAFPDNYSADASSGYCQLFVGIDCGNNNGDVYRIDAKQVPGTSPALDLNIGAAYGRQNIDIGALVASGNLPGLSLLAGTAFDTQVYTSRDSGENWERSLKEPTGEGVTSLILAENFAASGQAYAATRGSESAFSCSSDKGATWNQLSLINTTIGSSSIVDLAPSPNYARDNTIFLLTFGGKHSIWRSQSGGERWERIFSSTLADVDIINFIRVSPEYHSNHQVLYLAGSSQGQPAIWKSTDNGQSYSKHNVPSIVDVMAITDDNSLFIGGYDGEKAVVYRSADGATSFSEGSATGPQPLKSLVISSGPLETSLVLTGNINGLAYCSSDGANSFSSLTPALTSPSLSGSLSIAIDPGFDTNSTVYAASDNPDSGIYRFIIGQSQDWERIDASLPAGSMLCQLAVSRDGTLYAANYLASGGIERSINPAATSEPVFETINSGLLEGAKLSGLWISGHRLWSADNANTRLMTILDSLAQPVSLISPADEATNIGTVDGSTIRKIKLKWEPPGGAESYHWQIDADEEFKSVANDFKDETTDSQANSPALEPDNTYYWRVRVVQPMLGPWSNVWSFTTRSNTLAAPELMSPVSGAQNVPIRPNFQWRAVDGADSYELVLAGKSSLANPIIAKTGDYALSTTSWQSSLDLNYATRYYWKVRAVDKQTKSTWSLVSDFITENPPVTEESLEIPPLTPQLQPSTQAPPAPPPASPSNIPAWMLYVLVTLLAGLAFLVIALVVVLLRVKRQ